MSFFDRLFGRNRDDNDERRPEQRQLSEDEQAIERYRYMLRTAPPDQIEEAHAEAFARLTPEQRDMVLRELSANIPANERANADDPRALARMATRAEVRQPGTLERVWGGMRGPGYGGGYGNNQGMMGGIGFGGSFMSTMAGAFVGTAIANQLFGGWGAEFNGMDAGAGGLFGGDPGTEAGAEGDVGAEGGSGVGFGSWDGGHAGGHFGGDFGGGDFGGGGDF